MLLEFGFKNYRSYREYAEFDMMAPGSKVKGRFPDNYVHIKPGLDVLKTAVIVGENAGGKSNFVRAISYFLSLVNGNNEARAYRPEINTSNLKQDEKPESTVQTFALKIYVDPCIYCLKLVIDRFGIVEEKLSFSKRKNHPSDFSHIYHVFRRNEEQIEEQVAGKNEKGAIILHFEAEINAELDQSLTRRLEDSLQNDPMRPFLNRLDLLGNKHASAVLNWIRDSLCPEIAVFDYDVLKSIRKNEEEIDIINSPGFFDIFRMIDYSIVKISVNYDEPYQKSIVFRRGKNGNLFKRELQHDSSGVRAFFAWAVQIYKVVYMNKTVIADEMDRFLNPVMSDRVIAFINGMEHRGQFIFTTHNVLHLDLKTYMKEQIYFVSKDVETLESELYSLADFPDVRYETAKVYELYMKGVLGGTSSEQT